jgi:hypothetical protein
MIDRIQFIMMDSRLREAFPMSDSVFGGRSILFLGDFDQLIPIDDIPLFKL